MSLDFPALWSRAVAWRDYLNPAMQSYELWRGVFERVTIAEATLDEFRASRLRALLVLAEDWCGDAANTVPVLAALAERAGFELRVLPRDRFPDAMDAYLTNGTRSIPVAIGLDAELHALGHWGPRPAALQAWMLANKAMMPSPQRYAYARQWYARDRGVTTLAEVLRAVSQP